MSAHTVRMSCLCTPHEYYVLSHSKLLWVFCFVFCLFLDKCICVLMLHLRLVSRVPPRYDLTVINTLSYGLNVNAPVLWKTPHAHIDFLGNCFIAVLIFSRLSRIHCRNIKQMTNFLILSLNIVTAVAILLLFCCAVDTGRWLWYALVDGKPYALQFMSFDMYPI